jgi:hypothetical protein
MNVNIRAVPVFGFQLEAKDINLLLELSRSHYDFRCKQMSWSREEGADFNGPFTIWKQRLEIQEDVKAVSIEVNVSELSLTCKVLEQASWALTNEMLRRAISLKAVFMQGLAAAQDLAKSWDCELEISRTL